MFQYVSGVGLRSYRIKSRTDFLEGVRNITLGAKTYDIKSGRVMFRYVSGAGLRSYRIKSRTDFLEGVRNITHGAEA